MKIQKIFITIILCVSISITCLGIEKEIASNDSTQAKEVAKTSIEKKTYKLKDFKQSCCIGILNYSLKEVEGYIKSKANVETQELTVWYDYQKCTEEAIIKAINKTRYKVIKK